MIETSVVDRNSWLVVPEGLKHLIPSNFETLEAEGFAFARCGDGRFKDDRCLVETPGFVFLIDGVLLNKSELLGEFEAAGLVDLFQKMLRDQGPTHTLARLRGPFSGAILDRRSRRMMIFGNHTGDSAAFAYINGDLGPVYANTFDLAARVARGTGANLSFDAAAAHSMASFGFMIDDRTFAEEISRVGPGSVHILNLDSGTSRVEKYWALRVMGESQTGTIEAAVLELDRLFRASVQRCFEKDLEYGFRRHLVDMSGGMDARMVNVVAADLGYGQITNVTYSESGSDDFRYSQMLAQQLGNDLLFYPMNSGNTALEPEINLRLNSGMAFYSGITGGRFVLSSLNMDEFGLEHTGQMGGAVVGSFVSNPVRRAAPPNAGAFGHANTYPFGFDADDEELFVMRTRGFRGGMSSHLLRQHFTYPVSAYADIDLLEFAFSLPLEWRVGHRLFARWVQDCYPEALDVPTTRLMPFGTSPTRHAKVFAKKAVGVVARRTQHRVNRGGGGRGAVLAGFANSMNPLESWYARNEDFRSLISEAEGRVAELPIPEDLRAALVRSFGDAGSIWDKVLAVSVVSMHQMYFTD